LFTGTNLPKNRFGVAKIRDSAHTGKGIPAYFEPGPVGSEYWRKVLKSIQLAEIKNPGCVAGVSVSVPLY